MKCLNLHAVGDLRFEDVPIPEIREDEVLLHVRACGICGSDIPRIFQKGTYHFPTIPGHEFAGEITDAADTALIGRKAAVFPLLPCGHCPACEIGEYARCTDYDYYGSRRDGAFAEYIAVKRWNLIFFDNLSFEEAAMCEPAAVALHAIGKAAVGIGNTVAIFGAGPIGIMLALWARSSGAEKIILCDIDPRKTDFAKSLGFLSVNSTQTDPVDYIKAETGGVGADVCIEGAGAAATWQQSIGAAASSGRVVCMGNPSGDEFLPRNIYWEILRKELTIKGTWNSSYNSTHNDWKTALSAIGSGKIDVRPLVSHRFRLSEYKTAFDIILGKKEFFNKVMFTND